MQHDLIGPPTFQCVEREWTFHQTLPVWWKMVLEWD